MFICNFKINSNFIFKIFLTVLLIIVLFIICTSIFKLFGNSSNSINDDNIYDLTTNNYTNVLKAVHNNLDNYVGQQISFSGYVYRVYDFDNTQFVLARNMIISSDFQSLVVGFLCHCNTASSYSDGSWVNITRNYNKR